MADLRSGFAALESAKAALLADLASLDTAALNRRPDAAGWSMLQVVAHLTRSEESTLAYIRKKTQDPAALPRAGFLPWLRVGALVAGFHSPFKFKAPGAVADVPESGELEEACLAWDRVREDWREFVETFPEALSDRSIFRHPYVGMLGPVQVMIFLNQHLGRHRGQIRRIRRVLGV